eukprot:comp24222_c1_seq6/m.44603 comp24222_c1_seq6/g.44603  ORF comp24222_c1_seq6/g.44603 comp24222_c1_seq6/m.44603 type:complete len:278 (-) comp24222_c1_seq6:373-1206(-)
MPSTDHFQQEVQNPGAVGAVFAQPGTQSQIADPGPLHRTHSNPNKFKRKLSGSSTPATSKTENTSSLPRRNSSQTSQNFLSSGVGTPPAGKHEINQVESRPPSSQGWNGDEEGKKTVQSSSKASLKAAKKDYKKQKRELSKEIKPTDDVPIPNVIRRGDLKVRDSFKVWHERHFVLVPGMLHYYRIHHRSGKGTSRAPSVVQKQEDVMSVFTRRLFFWHDWLGTINLTGCQIIHRPSKKEGYCFKIFHPAGRSMYATKSVVESIPINADVLIMRAVD